MRNMPVYLVQTITRGADSTVTIAYACEIMADDIASAEVAVDQWLRQHSTNASIVRIVVSNMIVSERAFHQATWTRWYCDSENSKVQGRDPR